MSLQVIGAGLGRTGTLSLKVALEKLGYLPCYHMVELRSSDDGYERWATAAPDWDERFEGYVATTDHPGCDYWRELVEVYPDAKVVLTVRDPDGWYESVRATIASEAFYEMLGKAPPLLRRLFETAPSLRFMQRNRADRDAMTDFCRAHNRAVIDGVSADRLLVYEIGQGWEPLCQFLGMPVPDEPFPRVNERAALEEEIRKSAEGGVDLDGDRLRIRQLIAGLRQS